MIWGDVFLNLNVKTYWQQFQSEIDFYDVTLVCDDECIKTHKFIISSCSPVHILYLWGEEIGILTCYIFVFIRSGRLMFYHVVFLYLRGEED